jgi:hypothetical protein
MQNFPTCLRCSSDKIVTIVTRWDSDRGLGPLRCRSQIKKVQGHGYRPESFLVRGEGKGVSRHPGSGMGTA